MKSANKHIRMFHALAATAVLSLALAGCSGSAKDGATSDAAASSDAMSGGTKGEVTLVTHSSFPSDDFAAAASKATGYDVKVVAAGDGGELANQLVLTKGAPIADAFFGVDQVFASRIIENGVAEPYKPAELPTRAADYAVDEAGSLTPVDFGPTCINIDTGWFEKEGLEAPKSYEDLAKPEYKGLTVLLDPTSSTTGASFMIGTVAKFGEDGFTDYWKSLVDNDARIEQGWSDAYYGQFSAGGKDGTYPIVVSYSSSPAYTLSEDGSSSSTAAVLDTCSSQVEYTGVLAGAANSEGAKAVVDYLLSAEFQNTIAETMYMYPINPDAKIPEDWAKFAPLPEAGKLHDLPVSKIGEGRDGWFKAVSEAAGL